MTHAIHRNKVQSTKYKERKNSSMSSWSTHYGFLLDNFFYKKQ